MAVVKKERGAVALKKKRREEDDDTVDDVKGLALPTEKTEARDRLADYILLLFGEKKIGKTALAAQIDNNLFLATEEGTRALSVYKMTVNTWREAKKILALLKKDKKYKVVTVDIIDLLYTACEAYICQKRVIEDLSDEEWGKGWRAARREFATFMEDLSKLNKGLILISHADVREVTMRDGSKYDRIMPTMPKIAREIVEPMIDIWAYFGYDGRRRVLQLIGDDHVAAGHRLDGRFRTSDGRRIRLLDMGKSPEQALERLELAFENRYQPKRDSDLEESSTDSPKATKKVLKKKRS